MCFITPSNIHGKLKAVDRCAGDNGQQAVQARDLVDDLEVGDDLRTGAQGHLLKERLRASSVSSTFTTGVMPVGTRHDIPVGAGSQGGGKAPSWRRFARRRSCANQVGRR